MRSGDDQRHVQARVATVATGTAFARAALAGNPSDGDDGAVLAVCLRDFAAYVTLAARGADQACGATVVATG